MSNPEVDSLVAAWIAGEHTMFDACIDQPEAVWEAILVILRGELSDDDEALLAGGPLETLLADHGADFIDRVEAEAKRDPQFNHLLGGVWRNEMPLEIWDRVVKARKETW